jgi:hypothetical protein
LFFGEVSSPTLWSRQVFVVEYGVSKLRKFTVVRDFGTGVEVGDGVKAGEKVVLNPPVDLADGGKVQVCHRARFAHPQDQFVFCYLLKLSNKTAFAESIP